VSETARLFVAVDPAPAVVKRLGAAMAAARRLAPSAKWAATGSFHITLAFLGDMPVARVPDLVAAIGAAALLHAPVDLRVAGAGTFGGWRPRVLWAGVTGDVGALAALAGAVGAALAPFGYTLEHRPFTAHLTLARARDPRGDPAFAPCAAALAGEDFGSTRVEQVILYRSDLSPKGAAYTPLAALPLGA
jgi:2'-5' RNA ligase